MRIAIFINKFPATSQTFVMNHIVGLIDSGHSVDIFARQKGEQFASTILKNSNLEKKTCYYGWYLERSRHSRIGRFFCTLINLAKAFNRHPIVTARLLKLSRSIESYKILNDALVLLQGHRLNYDIVHCHFGPQGNLAALLKAIGFISGKLVTTFHGYDMSNYLEAYRIHVYDHLFKVGDLFLPVSSHWKQKLISLGCNAEKIIVHRMGVDLGKIDIESEKEKRGPINLITIARLVEKKGLSYGIEAVSVALKKYPSLKYRIVGDGPLKHSLENLITSLGITGSVELIGWRNQDEIFSLLSDSDILIAPSLTDSQGDQEGIPVSLMEAMAHGLPVLSTWHSGIPELVKNNESGFLVNEKDAQALAEKLIFMIENPDLCYEMGQVGKKTIMSDYDNEKLNTRILDIYTNIG